MDEYRRMKRVVKRMVRGARRRENEEWTLSVAENFEENKKILEGSERGHKRGNSEVIISEKLDGRGVNSDSEGKWKEYFCAKEKQIFPFMFFKL